MRKRKKAKQKKFGIGGLIISIPMMSLKIIHEHLYQTQSIIGDVTYFVGLMIFIISLFLIFCYED